MRLNTLELTKIKKIKQELFSTKNIIYTKRKGLDKPSLFFSRIAPISYFDLQVFMPNGAYKGQKLTKLVSRNTAANTSRTIPKVPVTTSKK